MIESGLKPERLLPSLTEVLIVGAGLSGLFLAQQLKERRISVLIIDSKKLNDFKNAYYLLSLLIAQSWEINLPSEVQATITGATIYNPSGKPIQTIPPNPQIEGFYPVPQSFLESSLKQKLGSIIFYDTGFIGLQEKPEKITIQTPQGYVDAKLVIDATGWPGAVIHSQFPEEDFLMTGLLGANYPTPNIDPRILYFIFGLPETNTNWLMPIGSSLSQILAGQYGQKSSILDWLKKQGDQALTKIINIYKKAGFTIEEKTQEPLSRMGFRQQPVAERYMRGRIIPFGEAAGLNNPLHGQLIDMLPYYADALSLIIAKAKEDNQWNLVGQKFFQFFLRNPPFIYFLHMALRKNQVRDSNRGQAQPSTVISLAYKEFGGQVIGLLQANGFSPEQIRTLIIKHPIEIINWFLTSVPSFIFVVAKCPFLLMQMVYSLRKSLRRLNIQ